jgi:hypothetical protein
MPPPAAPAVLAGEAAAQVRSPEASIAKKSPCRHSLQPPTQMTPASFFSAASSSSTLFTTRPPLRAGGSATLSTVRRGAKSTPVLLASMTSSGFFLAWMIFWICA